MKLLFYRSVKKLTWSYFISSGSCDIKYGKDQLLSFDISRVIFLKEGLLLFSAKCKMKSTSFQLMSFP